MGFRGQWLLAYSLLCCRARASYVYKGCYDAEGLKLTSLGQYTWQSVSYCEQQCDGSPLVALKNGDECLCGDSLDVLDSAQTGTCNVECNGWPYATCGGKDSLDVYVDNGLSHSHTSASSSSVTVTSTVKSSSVSYSGSSVSESSFASSSAFASASSSSVAPSSQSSSVAPASSRSSSTVASSSTAVPTSGYSSSSVASNVMTTSSHSSSNVVSSSSAVPTSSSSSSNAASSSSTVPTSSYSSSNVVSSSSAVPTSSYSISNVVSSSSAVPTSSPSTSSVASSSSAVPTPSYPSSSVVSSAIMSSNVAAPSTISEVTTGTSMTDSLTTSVGYVTKVIPTYITTDEKGEDQTVYVTTTAIQTSSITAVSKPYDKSTSKKSSGLNGGAIAGVVVGVVVGVAIITAGVCFYLWRRHVSRQEPDIEETKQYQPYSFGDADANPIAYHSSKSPSNWRKASNSRSSSCGTVPTGFLSASNSIGKGSLNSLLNIEDVGANYTRQNLPSTVFEEPPSIYNGNQRFSTGSLPDMMQERSFRVANPDGETNRVSQHKFDDEDEDEEENIFSTGSSGGSYVGPEPKYY